MAWQIQQAEGVERVFEDMRCLVRAVPPDRSEDGSDEDGGSPATDESGRHGGGGTTGRWSARLETGPAFGGFDVHDPHQLGRLGEELSACYLASAGYEIVARNYRTPWGEADLICRDHKENDLVLVEVKTRLGEEACPEEAVDRRKRLRYRNITLEYLRTHEEDEQVRFDVMAVSILGENCARLRHCTNLCIWEG